MEHQTVLYLVHENFRPQTWSRYFGHKLPLFSDLHTMGRQYFSGQVLKTTIPTPILLKNEGQDGMLPMYYMAGVDALSSYPHPLVRIQLCVYLRCQ